MMAINFLIGRKIGMTRIFDDMGSQMGGMFRTESSQTHTQSYQREQRQKEMEKEEEENRKEREREKEEKAVTENNKKIKRTTISPARLKKIILEEVQSALRYKCKQS